MKYLTLAVLALVLALAGLVTFAMPTSLGDTAAMAERPASDGAAVSAIAVAVSEADRLSASTPSSPLMPFLSWTRQRDTLTSPAASEVAVAGSRPVAL